MRRPARLGCIVVILLAGYGYLVWPTPWAHYTEISRGFTFHTRVHRITGRTERLFGSEWLPITPSPTTGRTVPAAGEHR